MTHLSVLGVAVDDALLERWLAFCSPERQPFRAVEGMQSDGPTRLDGCADEWADTFFTYDDGPWAWLSEDDVAEQSAATRSALTAERRKRLSFKPIPPWPSDPMRLVKVIRWVEATVRPSLHDLAHSQLRQASAGPLPGVADLAGTYPDRSGPNCFGAVMAAAGAADPRKSGHPDDFSAWLKRCTEPLTARDTDADRHHVLVWHEHGKLAHAAVTLGDGWTFHKPSQSWSSPTGVWPTHEVINSGRFPGSKLSRHRLL